MRFASLQRLEESVVVRDLGVIVIIDAPRGGAKNQKNNDVFHITYLTFLGRWIYRARQGDTHQKSRPAH